MKKKEKLCKKIILSIFSLLVLCRTAGAQDSQKATLTAADAGTCAATSTACLVINIPSGSGGATFNIGANASANTVQFEASADYGTTWVALSVFPSNSTTSVTSTTSTGAWQANVAGYTKVRMRCSTFVGGTTATYINLSTASARSNGGGGSVTHTAGNLTAFHIMLGNGAADATVDSACVTNGAGALSGCTSLSAGSGASAAGATATGGFAAVEAASTGWTPTAGQDYCRADSTVHNFVCSINGAAEQPSVVFTPSLTGMGGTGSGTGIQGLGTGINIVSPQSKQIDLQNNGSNGGATFRFLDDFATGDQELRLWATGGTGYDVLMASGAGGTPLGLILATQGSTFISMRPNNLAETVRFPGSGGIQLGTGQDVGISREGASILDVGNGTQGDVTGTIKPGKYATGTNCASGASPAVCASAAAGAVAVPTGTNPTLVINTTAVTASSRIFMQIDESLTISATTCNTTLSTLVQPVVTARTAATSFTIQIGAVIATNPVCVSYWIMD